MHELFYRARFGKKQRTGKFSCQGFCFLYRVFRCGATQNEKKYALFVRDCVKPLNDTAFFNCKPEICFCFSQGEPPLTFRKPLPPRVRREIWKAAWFLKREPHKRGLCKDNSLCRLPCPSYPPVPFLPAFLLRGVNLFYRAWCDSKRTFFAEFFFLPYRSSFVRYSAISSSESAASTGISTPYFSRSFSASSASCSCI